MKQFRIILGDADRQELEGFRRRYCDYRSERALAILHCAGGYNATNISKMLGRTVQTICSWLNAYLQEGLAGLERSFSPGRPSVRNAEIIPRIEVYLAQSPGDYGWGEDIWTIKTMIAQLRKDTGREFSHDSVSRALDDAGYSFKRAKKGVSVSAPGKETKLERVKAIIAEINALKASEDVEAVFLDESHFSTEPYVARGWHKRGEPFFPADSEKTRRMHDIWGIRAGKRFFFLEEFKEKQHLHLRSIPASATDSCRRKNTGHHSG